jgi:hypothetical protein
MGLVYGLITGVIFGFLLQKAQVLKYDKQIGGVRVLIPIDLDGWIAI